MTETKYAVHTPTKEEYDRLMKAYKKKGFPKAGTPLNYDIILPYVYHKECGLMSEWFVKDRGYTIITVDEAIAKLGLYERGQRVLVSDDNRGREEAIYFTTLEGIPSENDPIIAYTDDKKDDWASYKYIKPLEPTTLELTMKDIEDKYGCKVKIVK